MNSPINTNTQPRDPAQMPAPTQAHAKRRKNRPAPGTTATSPERPESTVSNDGFEVPIAETGEVFRSIWRFGE